jgi:Glycosyl transferase family 8
MLDLALLEPKDPRQGKRTGFSFARFAIPELAGYQGRALYLDADMLVFNDLAFLWRTPFAGTKAIIQDEIPAPAKRGGHTGGRIAYSGEAEHRDRLIVNAPIGDRDRSEATLAG